MELIIKPTERCNFKCTFCSSTNITDEKSKMLDLESIFTFLTRFPKTNTIIVNGGDPLMVPPSYYWKIIEFLDEKEMPTTLSFTTNLWAFKNSPNLWTPLFKNPRVAIATSFNYGNTRRVTKEIVYTEELFWSVSNLFLERVGYRPDFISVINDDNEDTAIDNVLLAKKMGVECKLNYALASGDQSRPYTLAKIYKIYIQIYEMGLWQWEYNTKQMMQRFSGRHQTCPQNRNCDSNIRCLQPSGDYYSCGAFADDRLYPISFAKEMAGTEVERPLLNRPEINSLKSECYTCPMFSICNGCKKTIHDMKTHDIVEEHCKRMKVIAGSILSINEKEVKLVIPKRRLEEVLT
jgi:radical SAM protein with 4Fe4S-binding SPASM domain